MALLNLRSLFETQPVQVDVVISFIARHQPVSYRPIAIWQREEVSDVPIVVQVEAAGNPIFRIKRQPWSW